MWDIDWKRLDMIHSYIFTSGLTGKKKNGHKSLYMLSKWRFMRPLSYFRELVCHWLIYRQDSLDHRPFCIYRNDFFDELITGCFEGYDYSTENYITHFEQHDNSNWWYRKPQTNVINCMDVPKQSQLVQRMRSFLWCAQVTRWCGGWTSRAFHFWSEDCTKATEKNCKLPFYLSFEASDWCVDSWCFHFVIVC